MKKYKKQVEERIKDVLLDDDNYSFDDCSECDGSGVNDDGGVCSNCGGTGRA